MRTLYFDVLSGASGDMILASLIDVGVPVLFLQEQFSQLGISGLTIGTERVKRSGIECAHMQLSWDEQKVYRHFSDIMALIRSGSFADTVIGRCEAVLLRLAGAEAAVHGTTIEKVHFHEIGAVDTIVDVLGAVLCLDYLKVDAVTFSTLTDGQGSVTTAHGLMPVPVPAVAKMIEGFNLRSLSVQTELLTPTGCALLTGLGTQTSAMTEGRVMKIGLGCGDKRLEHHTNLLRAFLIQSEATSASAAHDLVSVIESDMDHVSGEIMGLTAELCMQAGALDVCWMPVFMKKGRPGYRLSVLCKAGLRETLCDIIINNTRSLGVRWHSASRTIAERTTAEVSFLDASVQQKTCTYKGRSFRKLEYESLAALSRETKIPVIDLMEQFIKDEV